MSTPPGQPGRTGPLVIGLVGGIGAGKSAVARALARLGCVVYDADAEVRRVLARPEVRDELARWWGPGVIAGGAVDRSAVARIVFADAGERRRLESLIHPLLREARAVLRDQAARQGAPALVVDAPLLFEAGVDAECDAVVFVEAPLGVRLSRVSSRGWDAGELARRESAQWPLDEKKRRADAVIVNDAGQAELDERARALLDAWRVAPPGGRGSGRAERESG